MSGHSKWHKIQHQKGKNDAKKGSVFTKLCKSITIAVREAGADPEMNFSLRLAVEKAKQANVPKDNIDRAIKRGTGELKDQADIVELLYEGYGPSGVALLIEALTDNPTRTASEVKHALSANGGVLGAQGSVQWQFEKKGSILIAEEERLKVSDWEHAELTFIEAGVEDIRISPEGVELITSPGAFQQVSATVTSLGYTPETSGISWIAKTPATVESDVATRLRELCEELEDLDDVREVFTTIG